MTDAHATPFAALVLSAGAPLALATGAAGVDVLHGAALRDLVRERIEQVTRHGHDTVHDLDHDVAELPIAAGAYLALAQVLLSDGGPAMAFAEALPLWPWPDGFKPCPPRAALVKAAALLWAAIDRLDHAAPAAAPEVMHVSV